MIDLNVGFIQELIIDIDVTVFDLQLFSRHADNPMNDAIVQARGMEHDDIPPPRIAEPVGGLAYDHHLPVVKVRLHTDTLHLKIVHHGSDRQKDHQRQKHRQKDFTDELFHQLFIYPQ